MALQNLFFGAEGAENAESRQWPSQKGGSGWNFLLGLNAIFSELGGSSNVKLAQVTATRIFLISYLECRNEVARGRSRPGNSLKMRPCLQ